MWGLLQMQLGGEILARPDSARPLCLWMPVCLPACRGEWAYLAANSSCCLRLCSQVCSPASSSSSSSSSIIISGQLSCAWVSQWHKRA